MGSEKPRHVDKIPNSNFPLQNVEELNFCISSQAAPNHEITSVNFAGVGAPDMPSNVPLQFPSFPSVDVPLNGVSWMTDVSQLEGYKDFMFDSDPISSVGNMPAEYCTLGDVAAVDGTQMGMLSAEENSFRTQLMGNYGIHGTSRPVLCHAQYGNEIRNINSGTESAAQLEYPEKLDGSFLTLGVGTGTEARSLENDMSLHPELNSSCEEKAYKSHVYEAGGFSCLAQNAGKFSRQRQTDGLESLVQNAGEISSTMLGGGELSSLAHDVSCSLGLAQTAGRRPFSENSFGVTVSTSSSLSSNLLHMLQSSQIDQGELLSSLQQNVGVKSPVQNANAGQISSIKPNDRELSNLVHNASRSSSLVQNAGNSLGFAGGTSSCLDPNLLHRPPSSQNDQQHHFFMPVDGEFGLLGNRTSRVGYQNPNKGFHGFSCTSSTTHNSNQTALPGSGQQGMAAWPSLSSFTSQTTKQASDQLQKFNMGTTPVSQSLASWVSAVGITGNAASQDQSGNLRQSQATHRLQASDKLLIQDFIPGQEIPVKSISTPYTSNDAARSSIKRKVIQSPLVVPHVQCKKAHAAPAIAPLAWDTTSPPVAQTFYTLPTPHVQCKKTAHAAPVIAPLARNAPSPPMTLTADSLPAPQVQSNKKAYAASAIAPLAWNAPSPPLTQTVHSFPAPHMPGKKNAHAAPAIASLAKNAPLPPMTRKTHSLLPLIRKVPPPSPSLAHVTHPLQSQISPPHIKWQGPKPPQLSGYKCLICKRDLSYTPEGPVLVPSVPPAVAVLPCGHCFHDQCLQRITPEDEVKNPPCIPCALGEN